jgi:hypothetical protein
MKIVGFIGWLTAVSAPRESLPSSVSNIGTSYPENDVFGNICGVVGDPFQVSRNGKCIQRLRRRLRLGLHTTGKLGKCLVVHPINFVVAF